MAYKNTAMSIGLTNNETSNTISKKYNNYVPSIVERYGCNKEIVEISYDEDNTKLYVFKGFLNLDRKTTTDYTMRIKDLWTGREIKILVAYSSNTKKYYISYTQLQWLHSKKSYPAARFFESSDGSESMDGNMFNPFSRLALYGYSVGQKGLNDRERQEVLSYVIDNKVMYKSKIIAHLQGLICLRENRTDKDFSDAIRKWKMDINFVNGYKNS